MMTYARGASRWPDLSDDDIVRVVSERFSLPPEWVGEALAVADREAHDELERRLHEPMEAVGVRLEPGAWYDIHAGGYSRPHRGLVVVGPEWIETYDRRERGVQVLHFGKSGSPWPRKLTFRLSSLRSVEPIAPNAKQQQALEEDRRREEAWRQRQAAREEAAHADVEAGRG